MLLPRPLVALLWGAASLPSAAADKPTVPTLCSPANQGTCECGSGSIVTYVWWIPGDHQRCIHTYNLDGSFGGGTALPSLLTVSGYGQGMIGGNVIKKAAHYGYAAIGVGSTTKDGAGGFGLEFPNDGVANAGNPAPCGPEDSRDHAYIADLLDFIAGHGNLDPAKVYAEGFSQSSMFAAYIGVCFAERVAGIWQGGSGLARTGHTPVVPGKQAQCRLSDALDDLQNCCREDFCTDCTWWPVYPRTCEHEVVDCIASYNNDGIACGSDWYMYEAMVAENNDARLLSFSPTVNNGNHRNPENPYDWMVGCLGIVDSCGAACEADFLACADTDTYDACFKSMADGGLSGCDAATPCAPTLAMLNTSEEPVATLSRGKFGTTAGLPAPPPGESAPRPNCQFGTFAETGYGQCGSNGPPAPAPIEECGVTREPTTKAPVGPPTDAPTKTPTRTPRPTTSVPTCGATCAAEWPRCVDFHEGRGKDGCKVCGRELDTAGSQLVEQGQCVVGCALTAEMAALCGGTAPVTTPTRSPVRSPEVERTQSPVTSPGGECGTECAAEWPNCVNFHDNAGRDGCQVCWGELGKAGSNLVKKGKCVVGCTLTAEMAAKCGVATDAPTGSPTAATASPTPGCTQSVRSKFLLKVNKKSVETIKTCRWLDTKNAKQQKKICSKFVTHGTGKVQDAAQEACQKTCRSCGACYQNSNSIFFAGGGKNGKDPVYLTCERLKRRKKSQQRKLCKIRAAAAGTYGVAKEVCKGICQTDGC